MSPHQVIKRTITQAQSRDVSPAELATLIVEMLEAFGFTVVDQIPTDEQVAA